MDGVNRGDAQEGIPPYSNGAERRALAPSSVSGTFTHLGFPRRSWIDTVIIVADYGV